MILEAIMNARNQPTLLFKKELTAWPNVSNDFLVNVVIWRTHLMLHFFVQNVELNGHMLFLSE